MSTASFAARNDAASETGSGASTVPVDRSRKRLWWRVALPYAAAAGIIILLARGITVKQWTGVLWGVKPWWFLLASVASVSVWFVGDTLSFSRLFSAFHVKTTFREMLPVNAAQYFLQTVNHVAGGTALAFFMRRRKGVPIVSAGCSMIFLGLIDFLVMGVMGLLAALLVPTSLIASGWYYAVAVIAGIGLFAWFWRRGRPSTVILRWIYELPAFSSFRRARASHYLRLMLLRALIFTGEGLTLYVQLRSFGVHVPLVQVLAFEPVELFLTALPVTPAGLGIAQAVLVLGFHSYGSRATLLALSLAISTMGIMLRLPLGAGAGGAFAREFKGTPDAHRNLAVS